MPISKAKVDYRHSGSINLKSLNHLSSCGHKYWTGNFVEYLQYKLCSRDFRCGKKTMSHNCNWSFHSRSLTSKAMILLYMLVMSSSFLCRCLLRLFRWPVTTTRNGSQIPILYHSVLQNFCLSLLCVIWSHSTNKKKYFLKRPHISIINYFTILTSYTSSNNATNSRWWRALARIKFRVYITVSTTSALRTQCMKQLDAWESCS